MKKITSLILSALLMLSLIPAALAEEPAVTVTPLSLIHIRCV